ncbi:sigma-54-dependent Fis family transcriptional regulator [bacterium]|nr:sigma-54-dependent Fis family transcriptional regulator [candidate division CSSED10-310 bacterium]
MRHDILIVEDNPSMLRMLQATLAGEGWSIDCASSGEDAISKLGDHEYQVVVTDLKLSGVKNGMEVMYAAKAIDPLSAVVIMTAFGTIELAVTAMKEGALDFITKPFDTNLLILLITRAIEGRRLRTENILLREEFASRIGAPRILGKSPRFMEVIRQVQKVAAGETTVLLLGESGTGKELVARALHHLSDRCSGHFVAINCAAIPDNLLESELFGYERGAFTGAERKKIGKFEFADHGTLFLDEIGDLSLPLQAKLLRVLQEKEFERVGGTKTVNVDVRVIAASNKNMARLVNSRDFRDDLYYRLSVFPIVLPPLRDRMEDIPLLAEHFITRFAKELKRPGMKLSRDSIRKLQGYHWPGNIRELQNCIERAMILAAGQIIQPGDLGFSGLAEMEEVDLSAVPLEGTLQEGTQRAREVAERTMIRKALLAAGGNKTRAAVKLGVNYKTLLAKIKEYRLESRPQNGENPF